MQAKVFDNLPITQKLLVIIMAVTLSALLVACVLLFLLDVSLLRQTLMNSVDQSTRFAASHVGSELLHRDQGRTEERLHMLSQDPNIIAACVYDARGRVFARYFRDQRPMPFPDDPPLEARMYFSGGALHVMHPIMAVREHIGTLYVKADVSYLNYRIAMYALAMFLIILLSAVLAYLLSVHLQQLISKPISSLSLLARTVSEERDYSMRALKTSNDEFGTLVDEFNEMLSQIEARDRKLREAHEKLEERVSQRTLELKREIDEHKRTMAQLQCEITEHEKTERKLEQAQQVAEEANRFKSEFLANMSHEIRTPMNGIIGMAELLRGTTLSPVQEKYTDTIRRSGQVLLKIIGDILDYSKVEAGQLEIDATPFDLLVACEDVLELLTPRAEEKGVSLVLRYAPDTPRHVVGDTGRVRQIITNLVSNAVKFTHKGHILINVECRGRTESSAMLHFAVEDTGIGTPQDKQDQIFGQYEQAAPSIARKYGGTGLGLAISKQLVELMGGKIGVHSREGVGSRFYFTLVLPLHEQAGPLHEPPAVMNGLRVLLADPRKMSCKVLLERLSTLGLRPDAAASREELLQRVRKAAAKEDPYRIVLVDEHLLRGAAESLPEAVKAAAGSEETLLVLLAGASEPGDDFHIPRAGFAAYLRRPLRQDELMHTLARVREAQLRGEPVVLLDREDMAEHRQPDKSAVPAFRAGLNVLVTDDNEVNQQVAQQLLEGLGCTVTIATDGSEAVRWAVEESFDMIFMDCQMPNMDGFTATRHIREAETNRRHTPIIAMTAHAMKGDREKCLAAGMDDYISKPVLPDVLRAALQRWGAAAVESSKPPTPEAPRRAPVLESYQNEPVLDLKQALGVTGGRVDMLQRITKVFLQHTPQRVRELREALDNSALAEVNRLAHSIQGAASSLGGRRVWKLALGLEVRAQEEDADLQDAEALFALICEEFEALTEALNKIDWDELSRQREAALAQAVDG